MICESPAPVQDTLATLMKLHQDMEAVKPFPHDWPFIARTVLSHEVCCLDKEQVRYQQWIQSLGPIKILTNDLSHMSSLAVYDVTSKQLVPCLPTGVCILSMHCEDVLPNG